MVLNYRNLLFPIFDMFLPEYNTIYVYVIIIFRYLSYIRETKCIRSKIQEHNSGYGSTYTVSTHLRPLRVMAYICRIDEDESRSLRLNVENEKY